MKAKDGGGKGYLSEIDEIKVQIIELRQRLEECYADDALEFKYKLKISEDMDKLISKYYTLKKQKEE